MPIFEVQTLQEEKRPTVRLVKAERRSQVESFLLQDYEIKKADAERAAELAGNGTKVEEAW